MATLVNKVCACGKHYKARQADLDRGWAKSCSKSCAAIKRERKLDRNGYRTGGAPNDDGLELFHTAHLFDNCEQD